MNWNKVIPYILCFIAGIVVMVLFKGCGKDSSNPAKTYTKTDTLYLPKYIVDTNSKAIVFIPKYIIKYLHDTTEVSVAIVGNGKDTLYEDTTGIKYDGDKLTTGKGPVAPVFVPWGFLKKYPLSPKLVGGTFTKDSLIMTLLNNNADLETKFWPVNYDMYKYEWVNNQLKQYDNPDYKKLPNVRKNFYFESNAYAGYNAFTQSLSFSLDGSLNYKRVGVYVRGSFGSSNYAEGGVKFKIK